MGHDSYFKIFERDSEARLKADDVLEYDWEGHRHKYYGNRKVDILFILYVIAILLWALIAWYIQSSVGLFILFIPLIIFFITLISLNKLSVSVEDEMFRTNFLAAGMLLTLPLLTFVAKTFTGDRKLMVRVLLLAVTFTILSMVDIWVPEKYLSVTNHIRSIFQTIALTLILYSLYLFYEAMGEFPTLQSL